MARKRSLAALVLALSLLMWLEQSWLQTDTVDVFSAQLPAGFDGFRMVVLADLHGREFGPDNRQLLQQVAAAQPELIALCGDLYDVQTDFSMLESLLRALCTIAPVCYVTGNHEWAAGTVEQTYARLDWMRTLGVCVLANDCRVLTRGGDQIILAGVHDPNGPSDMAQPRQVVQAIREKYGAAFVLMLDHRNDRLALWQQLGVQVVLSGHGHGGLVRLPGVGGLFDTGRTVPAHYDSGLYSAGGTQLVVSRGLGASPGQLRLGNRPQILVVVFHRIQA